jgi:UPF0042 nucleotide-binding protein
MSGLSGSGKTTAMAALEDMGFYCADNIPVQLVEQFVVLCAKADPPIEKIALALDARESQFLEELPVLLEQLRETGASLEMIFLESSVEVLVNRYRETRRVHPLAPGGTVEEGIDAERRLLRDVARMADHVIDTSGLNVHELKAAVMQHILGGRRATVVNLQSFGFRYGTPQTLELLFDVRFLPNPYFEDSLRDRTGLERAVAAHALENPRGEEFFEHLTGWFDFLLPLYEQEGKAYVTIGFGCTGGRHRSVAVAEAFAEVLRKQGREVNVEHRDVGRIQ